MSDLKTQSLSLLLRTSPAVLREVARLCKFGRAHHRETNPGPQPSTFKEASDAAKVRLDAAKLWCSITYGTKSHGPIQIDEKTQEEIEREHEIDRFRHTDRKIRERMLAERIASSELTEEDAQVIREMIGDAKTKLQQDARPQEDGDGANRDDDT